MKNKTLVIIFSCLLFFCLLIAGLYFFKSNETEQIILEMEGKRVLGVGINSETLIYFDRDARKFVRVKNDTALEFPGLGFEPFEILYSLDLSKALLVGDIDNPGRGYELVDFNLSRHYTLNSKINSAQISPNGSTVAGYVLDRATNNASLTLFNELGEKMRDVYSYPYNEMMGYVLRWVGSEKILSLPTPPDLAMVPISEINILSNATREIIPSGPYLDIKVSPDNEKIVLLEFDAISEPSEDAGSFPVIPLPLNYISFYNLETGTKTNITPRVRTEMSQITWDQNSSSLYAITTDTHKILRVTIEGKIEVVGEYESDPSIYQTLLVNGGRELWVVTRSGLIKQSLLSNE